MSKLAVFFQGLKLSKTEKLRIMSLSLTELEEFVALRKEIDEATYKTEIETITYGVSSAAYLEALKKEWEKMDTLHINQVLRDDDEVKIGTVKITPLDVYFNLQHDAGHYYTLKAEYTFLNGEQYSFTYKDPINHIRDSLDLTWGCNSVAVKLKSSHNWLEAFVGDPNKPLSGSPDSTISALQKVHGMLKYIPEAELQLRYYLWPLAQYVMEKFIVGDLIPPVYTAVFEYLIEHDDAVKETAYMDTDGFVINTNVKKSDQLILAKKDDGYTRSNKNIKVYKRYLFLQGMSN